MPSFVEPSTSPISAARARRADAALVRVLCDHEDLWRHVDASAARVLMAFQAEHAPRGVIDLGPLYRYAIDLGVVPLAAAIFVVDLAGELEHIDLAAVVPDEVDDVLDGVELCGSDDPRFVHPWH